MMVFGFNCLFFVFKDADFVKPSVALPQMLLFGGLDTPQHVAASTPLEGLGRL